MLRLIQFVKKIKEAVSATPFIEYIIGFDLQNRLLAVHLMTPACRAVGNLRSEDSVRMQIELTRK